MITNKWYFFAAVSFSAVMYLFVPYLGYFLAIALLVLLWGLIKMYGVEVFMTPLRENESIDFHVTKGRKIMPQIIKEKTSGYFDLVTEFGTNQIIPDSDYKMFKKPVFFSLQGVGHTVKLEYTIVARIMEKLGIHTPEEAAKFLSIPLVGFDIKEERDVKTEEEGIARL